MITAIINNTNDGTQAPPYLRLDLNLGTLAELPAASTGPRGSQEQVYAAIKAAGYQGIQGGDPALCASLHLGVTTGGRVDAVGDAARLATEWQASGYACATLHVGTGMESEREMIALAEDVVATATRLAFPLFIETHRGTITQDQWRTVALTHAVPDVRFNGDFSHWYTGQEMAYGDLAARWDLLAPVFARVRFLHGRIGNSGSIQVGIAGHIDAPYVTHFREMWTRSMHGFLQKAAPGDYLCFAPELLGPTHAYARRFPNAHGEVVEESDRWQEALLLAQIARECFAEAQQRLAMTSSVLYKGEGHL